MNLVRPVGMVSPTGVMVQPKIKNNRVGDKIHVEAHWHDPNTGMFFHKGTVEIKDVPQEEK